VSVREVVVAVLLVAGVALQAIACAGLVVMRSAYDRLHFAAPASFGVALIGIAVAVQESFSLIGNKALATGLVVLVSSPVLAHVTARCLRIRAQGDWRPARGERIEVEQR
jgi:multisubunit Na+/H+ antiporter MnhG subunit